MFLKESKSKIKKKKNCVFVGGGGRVEGVAGGGR